MRIHNGGKSFKSINMKIFNNGNFQLTGLKKEQDGHKAIQLLVSNLSDIQKEYT